MLAGWFRARKQFDFALIVASSSMPAAHGRGPRTTGVYRLRVQRLEYRQAGIGRRSAAMRGTFIDRRLRTTRRIRHQVAQALASRKPESLGTPSFVESKGDGQAP